jgi:hypothetical protein
MKFREGDLVRIKAGTSMYSILDFASNVCIVVNPAILMYVHLDEHGNKKEFWAYEIFVDGRRFKNIPEEILEEFNRNEDEEDTE